MVRPVPFRAVRLPRARSGSLPWALLAALHAASCNDGGGGPAGGGSTTGGSAAAGPATAGSAEAFETLRARAVALDERGDDPAAARGALEAALALQPDHYGLNRRLGRLCMSLRLNEQALGALERALATRPDDLRTALSVVSLQVHLGRFEEALRRVPALVDDPELGGEALYQQARAFEALGQRDAARAAAERAAPLPPERAYRCQALLGRMALEDGEFEAAHAMFERARAGRPDHREAIKGLADSARRLGREQEALRWDRLLELFLQLNDSVFGRDPAQADARRALLETLLVEAPEWSAGYEQLAELQLAQGDKQASCATIEAWLARHGGTAPPQLAASLRRRYCERAP